VLAQVKPAILDNLPMRKVDFSNQSDRARYDKISILVEQMLTLHKRLALTETPDEKTRLQRQIDATDRQIDQLVYELYGLTEGEIKVVEEATRR
jgi:DNA mismatch repair ATPase MutL